MSDTPSYQTDSLLAIDIGTVTTRAFLFDAVDGAYRFVGVGTGKTTYNAPDKDPAEGVQIAIQRLHEITGRSFFDSSGGLILPSGTDGSGIDAVVATFSAGPPLKVVALGLLEDVSLESARNLADNISTQVVDAIAMTDRRKIEKQVDDILHIRPDLFIAAGGTDKGASKSVLRILDTVGLGCLLMPKGQRPKVLFAGNPDVTSQVESVLSEITTLRTAPNVRPSLENERLAGAQQELRELFRMIHIEKSPGLQEVDHWAEGRMMPTSYGFGRIIQFLSKLYEANKGVLGVDLGAGNVTIAAALEGRLGLKVNSQFGLGRPLVNLLAKLKANQVSRWLAFELPESEIRDYIYQKSIYPHSLPQTLEEMALEHALGRELLRTALEEARSQFPEGLQSVQPGLLPSFEPIIASGSLLSKAPSRGQSVLTLLDALEPTGLTTLVLDQHNLLSSLGAAAEINPLLTVQALESGALLNLGTVIAPAGNARHGTAVLRLRLKHDSGEEEKYDITQGSLQVIPLAPGQTVRVQIRPLNRTNVGLGGTVRVSGGALGIIIDARGRPLRLAPDKARRQELNKKWALSLK